MKENTKRSRATIIYLLVSVVVAGGLAYGGYSLENGKKDQLAQQLRSIDTRLTDLQTKTKQQDNINKGIVPSNNTYQDPKGKLGLLDGKILFTLPENWVRLPSQSCSLHNIDATVLCYDTAEIAPKNQAADSKDPYWNANISVFQYKNTDGTARGWFENEYSTGPLEDASGYSSTKIDESNINGNSALIVKNGEQNEGDSYNFYTIAHGSYAVIVSAQLKYGAVYGTYPGAPPYDYTSTYGPVLDQFIKSINFKDTK